ncbi:MAG TPA: hypothetical protein VFS30_04865 [Dehalococcoidia bacterium]|nr:hypothetical protein [Dehalococcoidia bacterium]
MSQIRMATCFDSGQVFVPALEDFVEPSLVSISNGWLQSEHALRQVPITIESPCKPGNSASIPAQGPGRKVYQMTRGVVARLSHMFGTKWGAIGVAGEDRECFFNRASLLTPEDFEHLIHGSEVEFDEKPDRTHGTRASRLTVIRPIAQASDSAGEAV